MNSAAHTPISGEYTFEPADLSVYDAIAGMLASMGKFGGALSHIDISGSSGTPDCQVKSGGHPVQLIMEFSAYVDGTAIAEDALVYKDRGKDRLVVIMPQSGMMAHLLVFPPDQPLAQKYRTHVDGDQIRVLT